MHRIGVFLYGVFDLIVVHGARYAEYRRNVPMLVPRIRGTQPAAAEMGQTEVA